MYVYYLIYFCLINFSFSQDELINIDVGHLNDACLVIEKMCNNEKYFYPFSSFIYIPFKVKTGQ